MTSLQDTSPIAALAPCSIQGALLDLLPLMHLGDDQFPDSIPIQQFEGIPVQLLLRGNPHTVNHEVKLVLAIISTSITFVAGAMISTRGELIVFEVLQDQPSRIHEGVVRIHHDVPCNLSTGVHAEFSEAPQHDNSRCLVIC